MNKEVYGHVANRIQGAVFREAIHMLESGVASLGDIDKAITDGPGLALGAHGPVSDLSPCRRRGRHGGFMQQFAPMQRKLWGELGTPTSTTTLQKAVVEAMQRELDGVAIADSSSDGTSASSRCSRAATPRRLRIP